MFSLHASSWVLGFGHLKCGRSLGRWQLPHGCGCSAPRLLGLLHSSGPCSLSQAFAQPPWLRRRGCVLEPVHKKILNLGFLVVRTEPPSQRSPTNSVPGCRTELCSPKCQLPAHNMPEAGLVSRQRMNGIRPTMAICDEDNFLQKWVLGPHPSLRLQGLRARTLREVS